MEAVVDRPGLLRHCLHLPPVALILQSGRVRLLPQTFLHLLVLLSDHFDALLEKLDIIPHQIVQTFNLFVSAAHVRVAIARCDALRDDALHVFRSHAVVHEMKRDYFNSYPTHCLLYRVLPPVS